MKYTPNWTTRPVQRRVKLVLDFIAKTFKVKNAELYLGKALLDDARHYGSSRNALSKYLKQITLTTTDNTYRFNSQANRSKRYRVNELGVNYLQEIVNGTTHLSWRQYREDVNNNNTQHTHNSVVKVYQEQVAQALFDRYSEEITTGNFVMTLKSNREYHNLQNIPRDIRRKKFAQMGYKYDYDIEAAAPTLLLQRARINGLTKETPVIDYLLANKVEIRNIIAQDCGISYEQSKQVITALFQGGRISTFHLNMIYSRTLNYDTRAMMALKDHALVEALKEEIRLMWKYLSKEIEKETYKDKNGVTKTRTTSGRQRAEIYRATEQLIMKQIKKYLKRQRQIRFITEHDGWRTDTKIDRDELRTYVRRTTGYRIMIDFTEVES